MVVDHLKVPDEYAPSEIILEKAHEFLKEFATLEVTKDTVIWLLHDGKSDAYYIVCHIEGNELAKRCDTDAVLYPEEGDEYKLNRNLYVDSYAYKLMEVDAIAGRSFEDLVIEYDDSYRPEKPLKVFGGQHRTHAVQAAADKGVSVFHGARIYFGLSVEQRFDIATVNNTSIAVSNDLLDRMQEELLGPELREWSQKIGLLKETQNFADTRNSAGIPTVRIARSLVLNFQRGRKEQANEIHNPIVCSSGPQVDKHYIEIRQTINWKDNKLIEMGKQFVDYMKGLQNPLKYL